MKSIKQTLYHVLDGIPDKTEWKTIELTKIVTGLVNKGRNEKDMKYPFPATILREMREWRDLRALRNCVCISKSKSLYRMEG